MKEPQNDMVGQEQEGIVVAREGAWKEMGELQAANAALESRLRFIREAAEGKIRLFSLSRKELLDALSKAGYPPGTTGGHEYLLATDISCMTVDGVQQLERERDNALARINEAKKSAALFAREQLKARMHALEQKKLRFEDVLSTLDKHKEALARDAATLQEQVVTKIAAVDVALASREAELLLQVGRIEQTKRGQCRDAGAELRSTGEVLTACVTDLETVLAHSDPYDFLAAASAVESAVQDALRRGDRGFAAPDASFQLRLDTDTQIATVRQIALVEAGGGGGREGAFALSRGVLAEKSPHLTAQAQVEKSQIHMISPGVSGRERNSIITVSSTVSARAAEPMPSIIGGHRLRPDAGDGGGGGGGGEQTAQHGGGGGAVSADTDEDVACVNTTAVHRMQELVQGGPGGALLKLSGMGLGEEDYAALHVILAGNPGITTIDMTDSGVGDAGVEAVAQVLAGAATAVTTLGLSGNKIGDEGSRHLARNNLIGFLGTQALAAALRSNTCLVKLNLKNNSLGEAGAYELAAMLRVNRTLTELNVWNNHLGPKGALALADALSTEDLCLHDLDLGCNQIGDEGLTGLSQSLATNASLTRLNLRWNEIGDSGLAALSTTLHQNTVLRELHLFGNNISQDNNVMKELEAKVSPILKIMK